LLSRAISCAASAGRPISVIISRTAVICRKDTSQKRQAQESARLTCGVPKLASYLQIRAFAGRDPNFGTPQAGVGSAGIPASRPTFGGAPRYRTPCNPEQVTRGIRHEWRMPESVRPSREGRVAGVRRHRVRFGRDFAVDLSASSATARTVSGYHRLPPWPVGRSSLGSAGIRGFRPCSRSLGIRRTTDSSTDVAGRAACLLSLGRRAPRVCPARSAAVRTARSGP
jgi:hypothetical protein